MIKENDRLKNLENWFVLLVIVCLSVFYYSGVASIPFHPDEASYIFMSRDFSIFFENPGRLSWTPASSETRDVLMRLIDPPITRYLIGFGGLFTESSPVNQDWDWAATWEENWSNGAIPEKEFLLFARLACAALFPFTLGLSFLIGKKAWGSWAGWVNLILTGTNGLVLLHTRRAMAEGFLLFAIVFCIWAILSWKKHRWLAAIPFALALNSKYLALPIILVGTFFIVSHKPFRWKQAAMNSVLIGLLMALFSFLLQPVFWANPINSARAALDIRSTLASTQNTDFGQINPGLAPTTIQGKVAAYLIQAYIAPINTYDVGNYLPQLSESITQYDTNPFHNLWRGTVGGGIFLFLSLFSIIIVASRGLSKANPARHFNLFILSGFGFTSLVLLITLPVFFQRYFMVLIPFQTLIIAAGIQYLLKTQKE